MGHHHQVDREHHHLLEPQEDQLCEGWDIIDRIRQVIGMGHLHAPLIADQEEYTWPTPTAGGYALEFASITLSQICSWRLIVATMSVGLRAASTQKASCGSSSVAN